MAKSDILSTRIEGIRSGWRRTRLWMDIWSGVLLLIGFVVVLGVADLLLSLSMAWRLALWTAVPSLALLGLIYLVATRRQRRLDRTRAALLAEKRYPHLEDQFVSAVQYADSEAPESPVAAHLVDQLLRDTRTEARMLNFGGVVPMAGLFRRLAAAVLAVATLGGLGGAYPDSVGVLLTRVLLPWRPVAPVLATRVQVSPGDVTLRRGSDQRLLARLRGRTADSATLHLRHAGSPWQERPMESVGADSFAYELFAVDADLDYRVTAGNGVTDTFHVSVYEPPELQRLTARYTFPQYTRRPVELRESGHVRAVQGTHVQLTAYYTKDLGRATLHLDTGDTLAADITGARARYDLVLADSSIYRLEARDLDGHHDETPRSYAIEAVPDAAPEVGFPEPGGDVWTIPADVVPVSVLARDDFGVSDLVFRYAVDDGAEQRVDMGRFAQPGVVEADGAHRFALRPLGLQPGSVITYYAEAGDWRAPQAQRTTSDLHVVAVKPYQERLAGFGGQCQGACQLLSARQAALLHDSWDLVRAPDADSAADADSLAGEQRSLRRDLSRLVMAAALSLDADLDEAASAAGAAMEEAVDDLEDSRPRLAVSDQQVALSALLRLEMLLPKKLGSGSGSGGGGGGGGDGGGDQTVTATEQLDEVLEDFAEQEDARRQTLFRRARKLLTRAKQDLAIQVALNGGWSAQVRDPAGVASDAAALRSQQHDAAEETSSLAGDVEALERALETDGTAATAMAAAAAHMLEAAGLGGEARLQAAMARGVKAQTRLERGIDALYLIVARHAGEVLPLLATALDDLGRRQGSLAAQVDGMLAAPPPWPLSATRARQAVIAASAAGLRRRLWEAAEEVGVLSDSLGLAARQASQAMLDSTIEKRLTRVDGLFGDSDGLRQAVPEQRRVALALRAIAAQLVAAISTAAETELAQVAAALNATRALQARVRAGGGGGGDGDGGLTQLRQLYEPLEEEALQSGLVQLQDAGVGGGDGPSSSRARQDALAALDDLADVLEARLQRLARQEDGSPFADDDYPPEYRELVQEYYRVLAEAGAIE